MFHYLVWIGYSFLTYFNLELLIFHYVVWIGYSFLTDAQLITVHVPLCSVDRVFLIDRCSTYNCWCSIVWCGYGIPSWQIFNLELLMFHCVVWIGYSFLTYFNLELLIFHCVVWIGYSFLTDAQHRTVDIPLCRVDRVFLLDRCSTYIYWCSIVWCG